MIPFFMAQALLFQGCGDISLSAAPDCLDADKNISIFESQRLSHQNIPAGTQVSLNLFETDELGNSRKFVPEDKNTEWPPRWFKDNVEIPPASDVLTAEIEGQNCDGEHFKAKFFSCGIEQEVSKRFFSGSCIPKTCELNGITAFEDEVRTFFKNSTVACGQECESLERRCVIPESGEPYFDGDENYSSPTCSLGVCPTTTTTSTTTTTTVPSPIRPPSPVTCNPEGGTLVTASWGTRVPWPSLGVRRTVNLIRGTVLSRSFVARTAVDPATGRLIKYGQFGISDLPNVPDGTVIPAGFDDQPFIEQSISEGAGCLDVEVRCKNLIYPSGAMGSGGISYAIVSEGTAPAPYSEGPGSLCQLVEGRTYYFNMTVGTNTEHRPGEPFCPYPDPRVPGVGGCLVHLTMIGN
jgi:hypothetical protein